MDIQQDKRFLTMAQILIWAIVLLLPASISFMISGNTEQARQVMNGSLILMLPCLLIYLVNYFFLVPACLFRKKRKKWFWIGNLILLAGMNFRSMFPGEVPQEVLDVFPFGESELWAFYGVSILTMTFFQSFFILIAVGIRNIGRAHRVELQLQEEKRKASEAELTWLKHQLNPHFLFNTLNNISSLTQIDPDRAQESIAQLSDTLRYALYETETEEVPLAGEVEFMDNYIRLMQLRCNANTEVTTSWELPAGEVRIAPLLFISPIENAFKHGVNARMPSFVHISLRPEGRDLVFSCENSLFAKAGGDHIGSGIGVENLRRRLELTYPEAHTYEQTEADRVYSVRIVLTNLIG